MRGAQKKTFTQEQIDEITDLRNAGYSYDNVAFMLHIGKERLKNFCVQVLGEEPAVKKDYVPEIEPCEVPLPKLSKPACHGHNPELWFAVLRRDAKAPERRQAKFNSEKAIKICSSCESQAQCLDYAVKAEPFGIWGGTTEAERMYMRKILNIKCAREGGIGQNMRGISRPMMNSLMKNASDVSHLFNNPMVINYLKLVKG